GPRRRSSAPCPESSCSHRYGTHAVDRHPTPAVVLPRTTLSPRHEEAPGCHIRQLSPGYGGIVVYGWNQLCRTKWVQGTRRLMTPQTRIRLTEIGRAHVSTPD